MTRHFAAWIACFAILFAAMAPSISHAVSASRGATLVEICSSAGTKMVKLDAGSKPAAAADALDHCMFCTAHANPAGFMLAQEYVFGLIAIGKIHPFLFLHAPHPLAIWTVPQSRGPPSFI